MKIQHVWRHTEISTTLVFRLELCTVGYNVTSYGTNPSRHPHGSETEDTGINRNERLTEILMPIKNLNVPNSFIDLMPAMGPFGVLHRKLSNAIVLTENNSLRSLKIVLRQVKLIRCMRDGSVFTQQERPDHKLNRMLQSSLHLLQNNDRTLLNNIVSGPLDNYSRTLFEQKQCHFHTCAQHRTAEQPSDQVNSSTGGSQESGQPHNDGTNDKPSRDQLQQAIPNLEDLVTKMFTNRHDYGVLHRNVVMENNLFGADKTCVGVSAYAMELMKLRFQVHLRFPSAVVEVQNAFILEESSVIRIHWRLKGVSQTQLFKVWRLFQQRNAVDKDEWAWVDAFSYFHIGKDGLVHKHRIDRMIPDMEGEEGKLTEKLKNLVTPKPVAG